MKKMLCALMVLLSACNHVDTPPILSWCDGVEKKMRQFSPIMADRISGIKWSDPVNEEVVIGVLGDSYRLSDAPFTGIIYYDPKGHGIMFTFFDPNNPLQHVDVDNNPRVTGVYFFDADESFLDGKFICPELLHGKTLLDVFPDL